MKKSKDKNVLIATLGLSPAVVSETAIKLETEGTILDRIVVVHTDDPRVWEKRTKSEIGIGLSDLIKYYADNKGNSGFVQAVSLGREDILSLEDNKDLLRILVKTIDSYQKQGFKVHVTIAGGRKTMSAMAQFAACLMGCAGLYHVLLNDNEVALTERYGFELPPETINLVKIPVIDYSQILVSSLCDSEVSGEKKDLSAYLQSVDYDVSLLVKRINDSLASEHGWRYLKTQYENKYNLYASLIDLLSALLRATIADIKPHPIIETRIKEFGSLYEKYQLWLLDSCRKVKGISDITDLAGLRIICYSLGDMEKVKKLIHELGQQKQLKIIRQKGKSDAYGGVAINKDFGYMAYHYDVRFCGERLKLPEYKHMKGLRAEIQITTIMHHGWAKLEHGLRYKSEQYRALDDYDKAKVSMNFQTAMLALNEALTHIEEIQNLYATHVTLKTQSR